VTSKGAVRQYGRLS